MNMEIRMSLPRKVMWGKYCVFSPPKFLPFEDFFFFFKETIYIVKILVKRKPDYGKWHMQIFGKLIFFPKLC